MPAGEKKGMSPMQRFAEKSELLRAKFPVVHIYSTHVQKSGCIEAIEDERGRISADNMPVAPALITVNSRAATGGGGRVFFVW